MSADQEEPMDVDSNNCEMQSKRKDVENAANEDEVRVTLSVEWDTDVPSKKCVNELQKALQTWVNKNSIKGEFTVLSISQDGTVSLRISPSSAKDELRPELVLSNRHGIKLKIISIHSTPSNAVTPTDDNVSLLSHASMAASQNEHALQWGQRTDNSAVGDEKHARIFPLSQFWYVNHIYKDEIQRIERENGVEITPEVKVNFRVKQKDGNAEKAAADFTNLLRSHCCKFSSSSVPLKKVSSWEIGNTLHAIKQRDVQALLTLSCEEMIVFGPAQSHNDITKLLQKTSISASVQDEEAASSSSYTTENTRRDMTWHSMSVKDSAIADGLTIDEDDWRLITTSYKEDLEKIKAKFGVDFKVSGTTRGKTTVRTHYKRSGGHPSMESHALTALLRLYQKVMTSPTNAQWLLGDSSKNRFGVDEESEGASAGSFTNGQSRNSGAPPVGGAVGGKDEEETCPICLDAFNNKTQLKCKHEFCEECLEKSKKISGAICPMCKDVFGVIEGDQPDGEMTWNTSSESLPGFPHCGTITIDYFIPSGIQTEKHPKPGVPYTGICRAAYLPNNKQGNKVLLLLKKAFDQKLIFTVGTSRTTGLDNQVTWNDIHHKTSRSGGPERFGYPDPGYLTRVREELQAKGIKE